MTSQFKPTRSLIIPKFQTWPLQKILKKILAFFRDEKSYFLSERKFSFFDKWEIQFGEIVKSRPVWADMSILNVVAVESKNIFRC